MSCFLSRRVLRKGKTKYKSWNKLTQCIFLIEKKYIGQLEQVLNEKIIIDKLNFCMNTCDFILGGSTRMHVYTLSCSLEVLYISCIH